MTLVADTLPQASIPAAATQAVRELLDHPGPLILANVAWGAIAVVAWLGMSIAPLLGIVLAVVLAWPATAVAMVAGRVVRGSDVSLGSAVRWPIRRPAVAVLGALGAMSAVVLIVNIQGALGRGDLLGIAFGTVAAWGLVALGVIASVAWPLLGDPRRAGVGVTETLRMAVMVTLVRTPRILCACLLVWCLLIVSAILAAAILTVSLSIAALFLARVVLPIADTLVPIPE
jgi:hypothetical protein